MPQDPSAVDDRSRAVQTAGGGIVVGSRQCEVCGAALQGRQTVACSEKCRAARWRQQRAQVQQHRDDELRMLVEAGRQVLDALAQRLARGGS